MSENKKTPKPRVKKTPVVKPDIDGIDQFVKPTVEPIIIEEPVVIKTSVQLFTEKLDNADDYTIHYRSKLVCTKGEPIKIATDGIIVNGVKYPYSGLDIKIK